MQPLQRNSLIIIISAIVLLLGVGLLVFYIVKQSQGEPRVRLSGNIVPILRVSQLIGPTDPNKQLHLTISLRLHNEAELNMMLTAINDPTSSEYHHYITPDQFKQRYSPTSTEVQQVVDFLKSQGLTVIDIAPNNTLIDASSTVAQAEKAFDVQINDYHFKQLNYYANANEPSVPTSLNSIILSIGGLDNAAKAHPESLKVQLY